jgi:phospholipid-translocating ATPase
MYVAIIYFDNSFVNLVTITFTCLIFLELLNVISEFSDPWKRKAWPMWAAVLLTVIIYLSSIIFMREYFQVSVITSGDFMMRVLALTMLCWLPLHILRKLKTCCDPNEEEKIMGPKCLCF